MVWLLRICKVGSKVLEEERLSHKGSSSTIRRRIAARARGSEEGEVRRLVGVLSTNSIGVLVQMELLVFGSIVST